MKSPIVLWISALVEKLFWTFTEVFATFALAQSTLDISTSKAAGMAGLAACITVILGVVTDWAIAEDTPFGVLVLLRTFRTFTASMLALVLEADEINLFNMETWQFAAIGSLPAVLATVKSLAAARIGNPNVPATLPTDLTKAA